MEAVNVSVSVEIEIREMEPADMADILAIEGPDGWTIEDFRSVETHENAKTVVTVIDDLVVSFLTVAARGQSITVLNVATRVEFRRCGHASRLMRNVIDSLSDPGSGANVVRLICRKENFETRGLMKSVGMHEVHSPVIGYYDDGESGILFCLTRCARQR